jgi:hypothetical protein
MEYFKKLIKRAISFSLNPINSKLDNIQNQFNHIQHQLNNIQAINKINAEDLMLNLSPKYQDPKHIAKYAAHLYSQNYEDSIISEILSRIGALTKTFLEVGTGNGKENNTRYLLEQGWSGVWIEGDLNNVNEARQKFSSYINSGKLKIIHSLVTAENINSLIDVECVDLLSVDIDMHTSYIWRTLALKARVAVIEYNSSIHPSVEFEVKYDDNKAWDGSNYFGASLKTLEKIGNEKGMALVGCDFLGVNAFFVSTEDLNDRFISPYTSEQHYEPPRYHLLKHRGHPAS